MPRVVPTCGYGVAWRPPGETRWREWDIQGHTRSSASAHVLTTSPEGELRFASGAIAPFSCVGQTGENRVDEPDWTASAALDDALGLRIDPSALEAGRIDTIEAALRLDGVEGETVSIERDPSADVWLPPPGEAYDALMPRINGRWVQRWFVPSR